MVTVISFNLTQDNCVRFLRGIAIYKAVLKNNFTIAGRKYLQNIKFVSQCASWYLVQFQTELDLQAFRQDYPEFNYTVSDSPRVN